MSAISPHSKRDRRRSSSAGISCGGRSLLMTICFCASCSALKVWKNSFCVPSLPDDELDVVHEQHVDGAITLAEIENPIVAHGVDHLVHEALGRDVGELQAVDGAGARSARWRASSASCRVRRRRR